MEANQLLECGKVVQLAGLSSAQWNGCIVSIEERSIDNGETRFTSEVIFGESKGKKLRVKESNLTEVPPPSPERRKCIQDELTKLKLNFTMGLKRHARLEKAVNNKSLLTVF